MKFVIPGDEIGLRLPQYIGSNYVIKQLLTIPYLNTSISKVVELEIQTTVI